jgi:hypothetical protein
MGTKPENHEQLGEWSGKPFFNNSGTLKRRIQDYQIIRVQAGWLKLKDRGLFYQNFTLELLKKTKRCRLELV